MPVRHPVALGDAGVLAPGQWRRLRALGWMVVLFVVAGLVLALPAGVNALSPIGPAWARILSLTALGLAYREFGLGVLIGLAMFVAVLSVLLASGACTTGPGRWTDWADDAVRDTGTALLEELLLRLIAVRLLIRAARLWPALALSAARSDPRRRCPRSWSAS